MRSLVLSPVLLATTVVHALPELSIVKRDRQTNGRTDLFARSIPAPPQLLRRQDGTVGSNIFDVLSWSSGGAYYTNGGSQAVEQTRGPKDASADHEVGG